MTARVKILCGACAVALGLLAGCRGKEYAPTREEPPKAPAAGRLGSTADQANKYNLEVSDQDHVDLVETVAEHRHLYGQALKKLRQYYFQQGNEKKRQWAEKELANYQLIKTYPYLVVDAIPGPDLRPKDSIPEANELYKDGMDYFRQGRGLIPFVNDHEKLKMAIEKFRSLIVQYPTSDKIAEAAFRMAEIYKEYFNDDKRALLWYQRSWEWDPNIKRAPRFQAAVITDYRLHDRKRALALYYQVLQHEYAIQSNRDFAVRRIKQLTQELEGMGGLNKLAVAPPRPEEEGTISGQELIARASAGTARQEEKIELGGETDVQLVDEINRERTAYADSLLKLVNYYHRRGLHFRRRWAERELADLRRVPTYRYVTTEIAPVEEGPKETVTTADETFADAMRLYESGKAGLGDKDKIRRAELKLIRLVREYPESDKIDDAAYFLGEMYDKHLDDKLQALDWYRKAWEWYAAIEQPARFNAARIYDEQGNSAKALELYRQVLKSERFDARNVLYAERRVKELQEEMSTVLPPPGGPAQEEMEEEK